MDLAMACAGLATAIPFRTDSPVPTGRLVAALSAVAIALAVAVVVLQMAKRRGWLARIAASNHGKAAPGDGIQLCASRRLSLSTSVYVLSRDGMEFIVVESGKGVSCQVHGLGERKVIGVDRK